MVAGLIAPEMRKRIEQYACITPLTPGDTLEIGVFTGEMTRELGLLAQEYGRWHFAIDPFDISSDSEREPLYREWLNGESQYAVYSDNIKDVRNIITVLARSDGAEKFLKGVKLTFAFIDGGHQAETVRHDLEMVWNHLVPGGWMLVHDYGHDIPEVTQEVDAFIQRQRPRDCCTKRLPELVTMAIQKVDHA